MSVILFFVYIYISSTIYPLLLRLEKKNLINSEFRPSPLGPSRKYYSLTKE
ncbi:helix-turn-helix transcriptional regulator [Clostridium algidicarnis]